MIYINQYTILTNIKANNNIIINNGTYQTINQWYQTNYNTHLQYQQDNNNNKIINKQIYDQYFAYLNNLNKRTKINPRLQRDINTNINQYKKNVTHEKLSHRQHTNLNGKELIQVSDQEYYLINMWYIYIYQHKHSSLEKHNHNGVLYIEQEIYNLYSIDQKCKYGVDNKEINPKYIKETICDIYKEHKLDIRDNTQLAIIAYGLYDLMNVWYTKEYKCKFLPAIQDKDNIYVDKIIVELYYYAHGIIEDNNNKDVKIINNILYDSINEWYQKNHKTCLKYRQDNSNNNKIIDKKIYIKYLDNIIKNKTNQQILFSDNERKIDQQLLNLQLFTSKPKNNNTTDNPYVQGQRVNIKPPTNPIVSKQINNNKNIQNDNKILCDNNELQHLFDSLHDNNDLALKTTNKWHIKKQQKNITQENQNKIQLLKDNINQQIANSIMNENRQKQLLPKQNSIEQTNATTLKDLHNTGYVYDNDALRQISPSIDNSIDFENKFNTILPIGIDSAIENTNDESSQQNDKSFNNKSIFGAIILGIIGLYVAVKPSHKTKKPIQPKESINDINHNIYSVNNNTSTIPPITAHNKYITKSMINNNSLNHPNKPDYTYHKSMTKSSISNNTNHQNAISKYKSYQPIIRR